MLGYLLIAIASALLAVRWIPVHGLNLALGTVSFGLQFAGIVLIAFESRERIAVITAVLFFVLLGAGYSVPAVALALFVAAYAAPLVGFTAYLAWRERSWMLAVSAALYAVSLIIWLFLAVVNRYLFALSIPSSVLAWYATRQYL
ncbi:hypothetical protein [Thermoproteus tenax]|nr:hypothetical protein [Thermoproteus tenax]